MRRTLVATGAASLAAAAVGGLGTDPDSAWYTALDRPPWQPPPFAFPLVWTPLYAAIAWGGARLIDAEPDRRRRHRLAVLLGADLAVNTAWSWTFFRGHSPAGALVVIGVLNGLNLALVRHAAARDGAAAAALAPYAAWVGFATVLNVAIWRRNS